MYDYEKDGFQLFSAGFFARPFLFVTFVMSNTTVSWLLGDFSSCGALDSFRIEGDGSQTQEESICIYNQEYQYMYLYTCM